MTKATSTKRVSVSKAGKPVAKNTKGQTSVRKGAVTEKISGQPGGKLGIIVGLLRRPHGSRIAELQKATGWQAHSIRGAMSGAIKKKLGLEIISTPDDAGRTYRIAQQA